MLRQAIKIALAIDPCFGFAVSHTPNRFSRKSHPSGFGSDWLATGGFTDEPHHSPPC